MKPTSPLNHNSRVNDYQTKPLLHATRIAFYSLAFTDLHKK